MSSKQYSKIFQKLDNNPSQWKKIFAQIYEEVSAENFDVIESIAIQIHNALANNNPPQSKMLAVRLFKDLLPAASYGFMLYSQSYLLNEIIKIVEFKIKGSTDDYEKYLFSTRPDTQTAQMGKQTYAMALESLKFAAETMTLHPYQRISFPSIFRLQYNRLSPLVRFPETYKFIDSNQKTKFSTNYNSKVKGIKNIIKSFQNRLHSRMSFCLSQGNFEIKYWLVKFIYTGESNIIPFVLDWVIKQIKNPQISTATKVEMMDFLNQVFVIGDIQVMNQFHNNIIPAMIEIAYPLDFTDFKIVANNQGLSETLRKRGKECLSFWGQISPESSDLLQCFSQKSPLLQGSRLYQSYAAFSQALELNIGYRNQINVNKQKFLISKNLSKHLLLLNQFYQKYPMGNDLIYIEQKAVTHTIPNIPVVKSEQFAHHIRTSQVINIVEQPSQSAINQLSIPGNSFLSKPESAGGYNNPRTDEYRYHPPPVSRFAESPMSLPRINLDHLDRSRISFSESNISNKIQQLQKMNRNGGVRFMDQVEVMNYEVHNQQNPKIYMEKRNLSSHISSRPPEEMIQPHVEEIRVEEQIQFHDSYAHQNHVMRDLYPTTPAHQYYEGEDKEHLPSQAIIRTVSKPQFKFPIPVMPVMQQQPPRQYEQVPQLRRVQSTQLFQPQQYPQPIRSAQETNHFMPPQSLHDNYFMRSTNNYEAKQPIVLSRPESVFRANKNQLLKRSQSSSAFNPLISLNQSLKGLGQHQYTPNPHQYQQRIKVLQNEVHTFLAIDEIHKQQMRQLKQQLEDVNSKVQHIASLQTFQPPNPEPYVVKDYEPVYQQVVEHIEVVQSPPLQTIVPPQPIVFPQPLTKLPKQIQSWNIANSSSNLLNIPPIRTSNRRKRQLMRNKEVLYKTKQLEIGFIMILKDYLQITVYYYFTYQSTEFKTQLVSPDLKCLQNTNFSYIPFVDAGTQKKQSYRFSYPSFNSLPFATPELAISYQSLNTRQEFKVLLPCIMLKFLTMIQKHPPQRYLNSYHSSPFILNPLFQKYQNLAELLPGLLPLNSEIGLKEFGVQSCYQQSTVYIKLMMFRDSFCLIQLYELRNVAGNRNLIKTIMEDLISILSTDL